MNLPELSSIDPAALKKLVERYQKVLFAFVLSFASFNRDQAFKITVQSFMRTLRNKTKFYKNEEFLEALFIESIKLSEEETPGGTADVSAFGSFSQRTVESLKIVRQAILFLSVRDKSILLLRDQCHLTLKSISRIMAMSVPEAQQVCLEARERLRNAVQEIIEKKGTDLSDAV